MQIELSSEMVTDIVKEDLVYNLQTFKESIDQVLETGEDANVFSKDVFEEIDYLLRKYNAIKEVLELYEV